MNHVFYKLANDAWIDVPDGGGYDGKIFSKERFAELIVKECAEVCRNQPNMYAMKLDRDNCAIAIEEHFGVDS